MAKVERGDGCWLWRGFVGDKGYGISYDPFTKRHANAHRAAWKYANGEIAAGLMVCHSCDNRLCVRVDHLFLGTAADNSADMVRKGRQGERPVTFARAKLSADDVIEIRRLRADGLTHAKIAARFGRSESAICHVLAGRRWHHVPSVGTGKVRQPVNS